MRIVWFIGFFLCAVIGAVGSASAQDVLVRYDDWTGSTTVTTPEREIFRSDDGIVVVRPVIIQNADGRAFGVFTNVRRRDVNGPMIDRMTSGQTAVNYVRHDRIYSHCIDGCQRAEVGVIYLSEDSFRMAATTGLPLRIWGQRARYDGHVPAEAFARVLARLQTTG